MTDASIPDDPKITRPRPSWSWRHQWHHRGRLDVHGKRMIEVTAAFSHNEDTVENGLLPNEIVIRYVHGQGDAEDIVRMNRGAATRLALQLQAALDWDGQ